METIGEKVKAKHSGSDRQGRFNFLAAGRGRPLKNKPGVMVSNRPSLGIAV